MNADATGIIDIDEESVQKGLQIVLNVRRKAFTDAIGALEAMATETALSDGIEAIKRLMG